jgi:hypothetical protein
VRRHFGAFGPITEVKLYRKGSYGFVRYKNHADAVRAIVGMNGQVGLRWRCASPLWRGAGCTVTGGHSRVPRPRLRRQPAPAAGQDTPAKCCPCASLPGRLPSPLLPTNLRPQALGGKVMKCSWGRHPNTPPSGVQTSLMLAAAAGINPLTMVSPGAPCRGWRPPAASLLPCRTPCHSASPLLGSWEGPVIRRPSEPCC